MKRLLIFTTWQDGDEIDLSPGSNLWYIRRYEKYFDEITHVLLCGNLSTKEHVIGKSRYVSVGTGRHKIDLILSPFRLYKFARQYKPFAFLTVEQVWLFWVASLVKVLMSAKIVLLPITDPETMYKLTGQSLSVVLPIWLERWLSSLSYRLSDKVVTCRNVGTYSDWMSKNRLISPKLIVTETLPEAIPTHIFFEEMEKALNDRTARGAGTAFRLIYVGRLHVEKAVEDVIRAMDVVKARKTPVRLTVVGDGDDRERLEKLVSDLGLSHSVDFVGWKTNGEIPHLLVDADAFIAPSAGGSLREAALCGLPIIAYDLDWIQGFLVDGETFLSAPQGDFRELANKVQLLVENRELRELLSNNIKELGWSIWSDENINESLDLIYA